MPPVRIHTASPLPSPQAVQRGKAAWPLLSLLQCFSGDQPCQTDCQRLQDPYHLLQSEALSGASQQLAEPYGIRHNSKPSESEKGSKAKQTRYHIA